MLDLVIVSVLWFAAGWVVSSMLAGLRSQPTQQGKHDRQDKADQVLGSPVP